ncbi:S41 family peptidase [Alkalibacillus aidingensis]|uniref:S41 family peptidase n=1 Tax=Alkalibacillus aidingensis TaxID=2747607 RepID=UPI001660449B|nr:S41 family peptidase [Alkalibacillus aidingensis]
MNINKKLLIVLLLLAFLVGGTVTATAMSLASGSDEPEVEDSTDPSDSEEPPQEESGKELSPSDDYAFFNQVMEMIQENYRDEVDEELLYEGAIEGIVNSLDDPFSEYMDSEATEEFNSQIESSFEGIGAEVTQRDDQITIIAPIGESPAEEAGLRPNDRILEVDGESMEGYTVTEAVSLIRGEKGTDVVLTIDRVGEDEPFEVVITRDTIPLTTVYADVQEYQDQRVGILEIRSFGEGTAEEFAEELERLESEENIDGLVLDVRGNPGGLFTSVEQVLSHFMDGDDPYVQTSRHDIEPEPYYLNGRGEKDYPISVLINEGSASASEILAAAMKEVGGYEIVGQTTFGKGTVQQTMPLGDGMLKLTVLNWLTPEGNEIEEVGVEPTIEVEQPDYYYLTLIQTEEPLQLDMNNSEVEKLQIMLEGLGYDINRTDGYFDEDTQQVVEEFQQAEGLDATGVVDEATEERLEELILEAVTDPANDVQLQTAVESLFQ